MAPTKTFGTVLRIAIPAYLAALPEPYRPGAADEFAKMLASADEFGRDYRTAATDPNLSTTGRTAAARTAAATALAKLAAIEASTVKNLTDRATSLERAALARVTLTPPKDPAERIAFELTMQEIRGQLRGLSATERAQVYLTTSDPMTLAAMDTAPMTLTPARPDGSRRLEPFIDPETRAAGLVARAEQADPENARLLGEVRALREAYSLALASVRREILDEVPGSVEAVPTA